MRKEYAKILKKLFRERLKEIAPEYEEIKISNPIYAGQSTFQYSPLEGILCFLILVPNPKGDDSYTLEVGWNISGVFPTVLQGSWITIYEVSRDHHEFNMPLCVCRIGAISAGKDVWWPIGDDWKVAMRSFDKYKTNTIKINTETAIIDVEKSLDEMFPVLIEYGIKYLDSFIKYRKAQI